jgi:hypothetical protein
MKKHLLPCLVAVFALMSIFLGCSDNDSNPPLIEGDYNDPAYIQAQGLAEIYVDSLAAFALDGFSYMEFDGTGPMKVASDSVDIRYNDSSSWWTVYAHYDTTDLNMTFLDSVRFEEGSEYRQWPDSLTTTGIGYHALASFDLAADSATFAGDFSQNMAIDGIQSDLVAFTGGSSADIEIQTNTVDYWQSYDGSILNVTFNRSDLEVLEDPHPISGGLDVTMLVVATTDQGSSSVSWHAIVTFYIDRYHVRLESGGNYWEWEGPYGG